AALINIKNIITNDPNQALRTWDNSSSSPCLWDHIKCYDPDNTYVTDISLSNQSLSAELAQLAYPLTLLPMLKQLDLSFNQLTGGLPGEFGHLNVTFLSLNDNLLTGEIPWAFADMQKLQWLYLQDNNLSGCFPQTLYPDHGQLLYV
ncbi:Probable LRR receptor-like serine/threonine-protein kinase, partial [Striga hermonthica]